MPIEDALEAVSIDKNSSGDSDKAIAKKEGSENTFEYENPECEIKL